MHMEKQMEDAVSALVESIQNSDVYRRYRNSKTELEKTPGLLNEIAKMREATIEGYRVSDQESLVEISTELQEKYSDLMKHPAVHVYLESETELIRSLQNISDAVLNAVELYVSDPE